LDVVHASGDSWKPDVEGIPAPPGYWAKQSGQETDGLSGKLRQKPLPPVALKRLIDDCDVAGSVDANRRHEEGEWRGRIT